MIGDEATRRKGKRLLFSEASTYIDDSKYSRLHTFGESRCNSFDHVES
jgi:hypothetical protein